jgi:hypothetical protein
VASSWHPDPNPRARCGAPLRERARFAGAVMSNPAIFLPVAVLALWTVAILALHSFSHGRGPTGDDTLRVGESAPAVADKTVANRNYMNLLELPVLFYVACIVLFVTGAASYAMIAAAWIFVALRVVHSVIHVTYNRVPHRSLVFAAGVVTVVVMWVVIVIHLLAASALYR